MTRVAMWGLLVVVAGSAAVLSFAALRDLAVLCGFSTRLAWLLPLVIDAGAAAGCLVWLGRERGTFSTSRLSGTQPTAGVQVEALNLNLDTRFARSLTFVLLATSVLGNAVVHGLTAYHLAAPWWLVVAVSAVAPAVLGAVVHLAVLVGRRTEVRAQSTETCRSEAQEYSGHRNASDLDPVADLIEQGAGRRRLARELGVSEHQARQLLASRNGAGS